MCVCVCVCVVRVYLHVCMCVSACAQVLCTDVFGMLSCVQRILGGSRHVNDRYSSEEFRQFRDENLVQLAVQYARVSDCTTTLLYILYSGRV